MLSRLLTFVTVASLAGSAYGAEPPHTRPTREQCEVATMLVHRLVGPPLVFSTRPVNYDYPTPLDREGVDPTLMRRLMQQPKRSAYECGTVARLLHERRVQVTSDAPEGVESIAIGLPTLNVSKNQAAVFIHQEIGGRFGGALEAAYFFKRDDLGVWQSIDPPALLRQSN